MADIATFSPPLKATAASDSLPRIVVGIGLTGDTPFLVCVDMTGTMELLGMAELTVDWRYDPKTEMWDDVGAVVASGPFGEEG